MEFNSFRRMNHSNLKQTSNPQGLFDMHCKETLFSIHMVFIIWLWRITIPLNHFLIEIIFALIKFTSQQPKVSNSHLSFYAILQKEAIMQRRKSRSKWNELLLLCLMHKCKEYIIAVILKGFFCSLLETCFINHNHKGNTRSNRVVCLDELNERRF